MPVQQPTDIFALVLGTPDGVAGHTKKEMLSESGGLCHNKPCGSSAAAVRGQGPGRGDMA